MNRYDNGSVSAYTPQSMEELAFVPLMKRQKHDQISAQQEALRAGLAKVDPSNKFFNEAITQKKAIEDKLDKMAGNLSENGFNNNMVGEALGLNREYQDLVSPTGKLGQINAEKINTEKTKQEYIKSALAMGQSQAMAETWANEAVTKYNDVNQIPLYDENGRVIDFKIDKASPKYYDLAELTQNIGTHAGMSSDEWERARSAFSYDANAGKFVIDRKKGGLTADNIKGLEKAQNYINGRIDSQSDPLRQSLDYNRMSPEEAKEQVANQLGIYVTKKIDSTDNESYSNVKWNDVGSIDPTGMIISNDSTLKSDALNKTTYSDAHKRVKALEIKQNKTSLEQSELEDLKELRNHADEKLKNNKEYNTIQSQWIKQHNKAIDYREKHYEKRKDGKYYLKKSSSVSNAQEYQDLTGALSVIQNKRQQIKDDIWKDSSSLRHNYAYIPQNSEEISIWNIHNESIFNAMKGMDLNNVLNLTSIYTTGGTKKNMTPADVINIQDLLNGADSKSFKINNVKTYGYNRTPEITMTFNPGKNSSKYDTEDPAWDDEYGNGKPVTVTFKLKPFSNAADTGSAPGYKNLSGLISGFYKDKGGINELTGNYQGAEVYNSMIENQYSKFSNEELSKRANVDSDARQALNIRASKLK
jgi:hypothetical protein